MANSYTGLFATLPAAADSASKAKVANNFLLDCVYKDFAPDPAQRMDTININVPDSSYTPQDVGTSQMSLQSVNSDPVGIQLNVHKAIYFPVPDFDTARTELDVRALFLDEAIKKLANTIDSVIGALFTSGNFNTYTPVATASQPYVADTQMASAWSSLANNDIDVRDMGNLFLAVHPTVYGQQATVPSWTQQSYVGDISSDIRRTAILGRQWGALADFDRFMPTTSTTHTSCLFHKYSIGLVSRPMAAPKVGAIESTTVFYKGLPLRVTIDWNQSYLAETIAVDVLFGVKVVRADHGILITTT